MWRKAEFWLLIVLIAGSLVAAVLGAVGGSFRG